MITKIIHKLETQKSLSWKKVIFKTPTINTLFNCERRDAFSPTVENRANISAFTTSIQLCAEGSSYRT